MLNASLPSKKQQDYSVLSLSTFRDIPWNAPFYSKLEFRALDETELKDEKARQFEVQTEIFAKLGVENPRQRSLYFSATLQGIMLMFSTYPEIFPLDEIKAQAIAELCQKR